MWWMESGDGNKLRRLAFRSAVISVAIGAILLSVFGTGSGISTANAGVGTGGTGAALSGPISGFGSVIMCGTRIDDSHAKITLDDTDNATRADLKLGMVIEVDGITHPGGKAGSATAIAGRSFVQGPVSAVDPEASQLAVLGVRVAVTARTVFDGVSGIGELAAGNVIEIYGLPDGLGGIMATRIEKKPHTNAIRLTGTAQNVTSSSFAVNGIAVHYVPAVLVGLPAGISDGMLVRIKGTASDLSSIVASQVRRSSAIPAVREGQRLLLEGIVTRFASPSDFEVNGMAVRLAANAKIEGKPGLGSVVEVDGIMTGKALVAGSVEEDDIDSPEDSELHRVRILAIDRAGHTMTVRNGDIIVRWDANTVFDRSALPLGAGSLAPHLNVDITGKVKGNVLLAAEIRRSSE